MAVDEVNRILDETNQNNKSDFTMDLELKTEKGEVVAVVSGIRQLRRIPEDMNGAFKTA